MECHLIIPGATVPHFGASTTRKVFKPIEDLPLECVVVAIEVVPS
jgi:hypothetical protein